MTLPLSQSKPPNISDSAPGPPPTKRRKTGNHASENDTTPESAPADSDFVKTKYHGGNAGLDSSLPVVESGDQVKKYETEKSTTYQSSIYVDAFNLALDTVMKDESYLFSEEEAEVFAKYRSLDYESQYLYVRLFLRKTAAWFRIQKFQYHSNIADMDTACSILQSEDIGFADKDNIITLEEVANLLTLDELKLVAKEAKCQGTNKAQLISELQKACKGQGCFQRSGYQLQLNYDQKGNYMNQEEKFVKRILEKTGPCIRLRDMVTMLFNRVHLVFYRSTEWTKKSLTTVILSRTKLRNFPEYIVSRTCNIFPTRPALLEFEAAIKLQSEVDEVLVDSGVPSEDGLQRVHDIFESIYPKWRQLVLEERNQSQSQSHDDAMERVYLRRFHAAWVYTRIVHKGVYVLGRFKEYAREHSVLSALLGQKFFQSARRGAWYQRKALIEENYMASLDPLYSTKKDVTIKKWRQTALETCEAGLQDPLTHIIYHFELQKRILKLEKKLRIPMKDQHDFGHARLRKPTDKLMYGDRIGESELGKKTKWKDPAEDGAECSVEEMCLSHYRQEGWKGYHCEGGLVKTLFAYLFYDILFLYLPNVFETEFQTCPLDLFTDAFYPSRASEINHRLVEIENGGAKDLIRSIWERENERKTCVVGLDWSYVIEDLLEIAECIPGEALSVICKVLCQEYRQRSGGMPDLFLWNPEKKVCLFSEVKSENDRLSDTQRLWVHVLSSAGVGVELCTARSNKAD